MPLIYLIRHAENRANVERRMSHRVIDFELTELGHRQAERLAEWFADKPIARLYTSPMNRTRQTAEHIARRTGAEIEEVEALRELNCGELDGLGDEASWAIHDDILRRWRAGEHDLSFPGGECHREAWERLGGVITDVAARHANEDAAIVGHGGLFSLALPRLVTLPGHDGTSPLRLHNTAITILRHDAGELSCELWGAVDHLPADHLPDGRR